MTTDSELLHGLTQHLNEHTPDLNAITVGKTLDEISASVNSALSSAHTMYDKCISLMEKYTTERANGEGDGPITGDLLAAVEVMEQVTIWKDSTLSAAIITGMKRAEENGMDRIVAGAALCRRASFGCDECDKNTGALLLKLADALTCIGIMDASSQ